jgi:alpha 1,3-glucosidase
MIGTASLSGFPFTGEDLGGHGGDTNSELITRWYQAGAWCYPFMREHSTLISHYREPWVWDEPTYHRLVNSIRDRYSVIGLWYTHSVLTNWTGRPPVVPLFYEFPEIEETHSIDNQLLLGDSIMVTPVTDQGATHVHVWKPSGLWYDFRNGREFKESGDISVTLDDIPLHIRGGRIVPTYPKAVHNTIETIVTPMTLIVAVDSESKAEGSLYLDDGVTYNYTLGEYVYRQFVYDHGVLKWRKADGKEKTVPKFLANAIIDTIIIYSPAGVRRVTGLKFAVGGEWTWNQNSPALGSQAIRKNLVGFIACFALVGVVGIMAVVMIKKQTPVEDVGLRSIPLISAE